ncbi:MAG: peptidoglycan-binding domain-containing protein [Halioglobus sp.]
MKWKAAAVVMVLAGSLAGGALSDELTKIVQQDLTTLGYDTGGTDGTANTKTIIAVSKFQSEHNMPVTGDITPQLAGVIKATISKKDSATTAAQPAVAATTQTTPEQAQAELKARQEACLQEKVAAAQQSASLRSGFGKLLSAVSRTASQFGSGTTAAEISSTTSDVYSVNATVNDLEGAARDLGISESDIEACRNP